MVGVLDVMGVSGNLSPLVVIGFNHDVAWTHTVSTGQRFTLYELKLDPADPTVYLVDGERRRMTSKAVALPPEASASASAISKSITSGPAILRTRSTSLRVTAASFPFSEASPVRNSHAKATRPVPVSA